jgi:predicted methyltransferase
MGMKYTAFKRKSLQYWQVIKKLLITNVHILIYFLASEFIRSLLPFGLES